MTTTMTEMTTTMTEMTTMQKTTATATATTVEPYGSIIDYHTGDILRAATRVDWIHAQEAGDPHTGAHREDCRRGSVDMTLTVFCDGPATTADPAINLRPLGKEQIAALPSEGRVFVRECGVDRAHPAYLCHYRRTERATFWIRLPHGAFEARDFEHNGYSRYRQAQAGWVMVG